MNLLDKREYLGIKESILLVFLYSFILKKIIVFLCSSMFYVFTKEGWWTYIIIGTCVGIFAWGMTIYLTRQYIWARKWYDQDNQYKIDLVPLLIGLIGVIIIHLINNMIMSVFNGLLTGEWQYMWGWGYMNRYQPREWILESISLCIIAPIAEEYFYRGIILKGLSYRYSMRKSIAISTVLFMLMHIPVGRELSVIIPSIILGYLYLKYKSLGLCMLIHACSNLVVVIDPSRNQTLLGLVLLVATLSVIYRAQLSRKRERNCGND